MSIAIPTNGINFTKPAIQATMIPMITTGNARIKNIINKALKVITLQSPLSL